jgi:hypothetical protein
MWSISYGTNEEEAAKRHAQPQVDTFEVIFGAKNVLHVKVERQIRSRRAKSARRAQRSRGATLA